MVDVRDLEVRKQGRVICRVPELALPAGARLAVIGGNGTGKSTLLRVLAGLERDFGGRCAVDAAPTERTYVHQSPYLLRGSVSFNVAYGLRARGRSRAAARDAAAEWLDRLGVGELASRSSRTLSGGEARRVALARALIVRPRLVLLDEPLADLDAEGAARVADVLRELAETTLVIASPTPLPPELTDSELRLVAPAAS